MKTLHLSLVCLLYLSIGTIQLLAQSNQYLHFDGTDDVVRVDNASQYVTGAEEISMIGWFKNDQLSYGQGMMGLRGEGSGSGQMYLIQLDNGKIECRVVTNTGLHQVVAPAGTLKAGVWQHIAWVFDKNKISLYVDGDLIGSNLASGTFYATDRPFAIGKNILPGYNFIYKGGIDEISLWDRAVTQTEIQGIMTDELVGFEEGLQLYYKFDQGTPEGNNAGITELLEISGTAAKHGKLENFALLGSTSNFLGELSSGTQAINFTPIPNKLISDAPFTLAPTTNSGLPVSLEVLSGPATINGNTVTLTGATGEVQIKASQAGDANWDPAPDVTNTFLVLDPAKELVAANFLHPLAGDVHMPSLMPIELAVFAEIDYPELFSVDMVEIEVDGARTELYHNGNGYYAGWWTPTAYGSHELTIRTKNNFGFENTTSAVLNLQEQAVDQSAVATDKVWVSANASSVIVESDLPSHIGAYTQIMGTLTITCPTGGCDPWDRVSSIDVQGKNGKWMEIIRYLTPYGVPCNHSIDLTDFASVLKGKTKFRVNLGTVGNGFLYSLDLDYTAGTAQYPYSKIQNLWNTTYQFGDMANLQPVPERSREFPDNTQAAKIKILATGHGWGENNTSNAAEFSNNTHHIWVNGQQTFTQNNWLVCDPNPDGCSPQNGTWYFSRAGWCPGSIAPYFDYDMTPYISDDVSLKYIFDEDYRDLCHPSNPNCVSGVTCPNCNDGFNPHLITNSFLISFGSSPLGSLSASSEIEVKDLHVYPNPSAGKFYMDTEANTITDVVLYNILGEAVHSASITESGGSTAIDVSHVAAGVYLLRAMNKNKIVAQTKIIVE